LKIFLKLVPGSNVDSAISDAKIENPAFVQVVLDTEGLQNKRSLEACADVKNCVFGQQLHSDKYRLLSLKTNTITSITKTIAFLNVFVIFDSDNQVVTFAMVL
jgi:hypothetical protein